MQAVVSIPHPLFFVSVADKGVSVAVSGLESTVVDGCVSVDSSRHRRAKVQRSKRVCRLLGGGSCGRSGGRRCFCLGWVVGWMGRRLELEGLASEWAKGFVVRRGLTVLWVGAEAVWV